MHIMYIYAYIYTFIHIDASIGKTINKNKTMHICTVFKDKVQYCCGSGSTNELFSLCFLLWQEANEVVLNMLLW